MMIQMKHRLFIVMAAAFTAAAFFSDAMAGASPEQFMRSFSGEIHSALDNGNARGANMLFVKYFDMQKFGRLCLIDHWDEFSDQERADYTDLLGKNIMKRMGEKMLFTKDDRNFKLQVKRITRRRDRTVEVRNMLKVHKGDFELVLHLLPAKNGYRMYDYELEGALLSRNYQGHFNYMIRKYGKAGFLAKLKERSVVSDRPLASN